MPPKQLKTKASVKAELPNKVLEIRLKQQKWLQEREESRVVNATKSHNNVTGPNVKVSSPPVAGNNHSSTSGRDVSKPIPVKANTQPQSGFHTWVSNRKLPNESPESPKPAVGKGLSPEYNPSNYHDNNISDEVEMQPLNLPSNCSVTSSSGSKEARSDSCSNEYQDRIVQNGSLSPDKFDALADEIVNRVKRELQLESRDSPANGNKASANQIKCNLVGKEDAEKDTLGTNELCDIYSHKCPVCHELMLPPTCRPLLLIPCGHTSCQNCVRNGNSCSLCNHRIQSSTPNIMLQQIILDYHQRSLPDNSKLHDQIKSPEMPARSKRSQVEGNNSQINQMGKTYSYIPSQTDISKTPRKTAEEYEEEYHNLVLRCDVLHEEEKVICDKMAAIEQQKQTENKQIDNICTTQRRLQQDIEKLQQQIEALDKHKEGYKAKIEDLDTEKRKERRRLEMVKSTINQLKTEINKVKRELDKAY